MKFPCTVQRLSANQWRARHQGGRLGTVEVTAPSPAEALAKLRDELRYRVEFCPCSGVSEVYVELDISEHDYSSQTGCV